MVGSDKVSFNGVNFDWVNFNGVRFKGDQGGTAGYEGTR